MDKRTDGNITLEQWQRFYDAAARVRGMEPWRWMEETDLIGVQNPEDDSVALVSVMGHLGEHRAIGRYPCGRRRSGFVQITNLPPSSQV